MRKRKRAPRTIDAGGADLGAIETPIDPFGIPPGFDPGGEVNWTQASDPDLMQAIVPGGTSMPTNITGLSRVRDYPQPGLDTWYAPTTAAIARGRINAAIDTLGETGDRIAAVGLGLAQNWIPLLLGAAALYILFQMERR